MSNPDDHPIIIRIAESAGTFDGEAWSFKRAVIREIEQLTLRLAECEPAWVLQQIRAGNFTVAPLQQEGAPPTLTEAVT